jgi:hypothetical protein
VGRLRICDETGADVTAQAREKCEDPDGFDRFMFDAQLLVERSVLRGPTDDELPELEKYGFDPTTARRGQEARAQQEREQAERFANYPALLRGRTREAVAARYVIVELMDLLMESYGERGIGLEDLFPEDEELQQSFMRAFVDGMPSGDVHVSLQTASHRGRSKWEPNDFHDIDFLSVGVAYCDIVATEKHRAHQLRAQGVHERLGTRVLTSLDHLAAAL